MKGPANLLEEGRGYYRLSSLVMGRYTKTSSKRQAQFKPLSVNCHLYGKGKVAKIGFILRSSLSLSLWVCMASPVSIYRSWVNVQVIFICLFQIAYIHVHLQYLLTLMMKSWQLHMHPKVSRHHDRSEKDTGWDMRSRSQGYKGWWGTWLCL